MKLVVSQGEWTGGRIHPDAAKIRDTASKVGRRAEVVLFDSQMDKKAVLSGTQHLGYVPKTPFIIALSDDEKTVLAARSDNPSPSSVRKLIEEAAAKEVALAAPRETAIVMSESHPVA